MRIFSDMDGSSQVGKITNHLSSLYLNCDVQHLETGHHKFVLCFFWTVTFFHLVISTPLYNSPSLYTLCDHPSCMIPFMPNFPYDTFVLCHMCNWHCAKMNFPTSRCLSWCQTSPDFRQGNFPVNWTYFQRKLETNCVLYAFTIIT